MTLCMEETQGRVEDPKWLFYHQRESTGGAFAGTGIHELQGEPWPLEMKPTCTVLSSKAKAADPQWWRGQGAHGVLGGAQRGVQGGADRSKLKTPRE